MVLTAEQAFKISQKGAIREKKKSKKRYAKEFRLAIKKIRKAARQGKTEIPLYINFISYSTVAKLNKLGYKTNYCYGGVDVSWEDAETSVTAHEGEVSA
jgi:hypothetical protein